MSDRPPRLPPGLVRVERGRPGESVRQPPLEWSPDEAAGFFVHRRPLEVERIPEREAIVVTDTDVGLRDGRDQMVNRVLAQIDESWMNGGVAARAYGLAVLGRAEQPALDAGLALGLLAAIAGERLLPAVLAGASIDFLAEQGIRRVPAQTLAHSIYAALRGGAYSQGLPPARAEELTRAFMDALLGYSPSESRAVFALDPGFSCFFARLHWDLAFLVVDLHEYWALLLCATDCD